jgi:hypothetical protein
MYGGCEEGRSRKYAKALGADFFVSQTLVMPCNDPALRIQTRNGHRSSLNIHQSMRTAKSQERCISCLSNSSFWANQINT